MSSNQRLIDVIRQAIAQETADGAKITYTPGVISDFGGAYNPAGAYLVSAYIHADEPLYDIEVPSGMLLASGDYIVVGISGEGYAWVDRQLPYNDYAKLAINPSTGEIATGTGSAYPTVAPLGYALMSGGEGASAYFGQVSGGGNNYTDADAIAAVEGEPTLVLQDVTADSIDTGKLVGTYQLASISSDNALITLNADTSILEVQANGWSIGGITGGEAGRILVIRTGTSGITWLYEDTTQTVANRIQTPRLSDWLSPGRSTFMAYHNGSRWFLGEGPTKADSTTTLTYGMTGSAGIAYEQWAAEDHTHTMPAGYTDADARAAMETPAATDDIGDPAAEWRNGYFSGTVTVDTLIANNFSGIPASAHGSLTGIGADDHHDRAHDHSNSLDGNVLRPASVDTLLPETPGTDTLGNAANNWASVHATGGNVYTRYITNDSGSDFRILAKSWIYYSTESDGSLTYVLNSSAFRPFAGDSGADLGADGIGFDRLYLDTATSTTAPPVLHMRNDFTPTAWMQLAKIQAYSSHGLHGELRFNAGDSIGAADLEGSLNVMLVPDNGTVLDTVASFADGGSGIWQLRPGEYTNSIGTLGLGAAWDRMRDIYVQDAYIYGDLGGVTPNGGDFAYFNDGTGLWEPKKAFLGSGVAPDAPTTVVASTSTTQNADGTIDPSVSITWVDATDSYVVGYEVEIDQVPVDVNGVPQTADWVGKVGYQRIGVDTEACSFTTNIISGTYYNVRIRAVNIDDQTSAWVYAGNIQAAQDDEAPNIPDAPIVGGGFQMVGASWDAGNAEDYLFSQVRWRRTDILTPDIIWTDSFGREDATTTLSGNWSNDAVTSGSYINGENTAYHYVDTSFAGNSWSNADYDDVQTFVTGGTIRVEFSQAHTGTVTAGNAVQNRFIIYPNADTVDNLQLYVTTAGNNGTIFMGVYGGATAGWLSSPTTESTGVTDYNGEFHDYYFEYDTSNGAWSFGIDGTEVQSGTDANYTIRDWSTGFWVRNQHLAYEATVTTGDSFVWEYGNITISDSENVVNNEDWEIRKVASTSTLINGLIENKPYEVQVRNIDRSGNVQASGGGVVDYRDDEFSGWSDSGSASTTDIDQSSVAFQGIIAEIVASDYIDASYIQAGDLTLGKPNQAGTARVYNANSKPIGAWGEFGLVIANPNNPGDAVFLSPDGEIKITEAYTWDGLVDIELGLTATPAANWSTALTAHGINAGAITFGTQGGGNNRVLNAGFELRTLDTATLEQTIFTDSTDWNGTAIGTVINLTTTGTELEMTTV